MAAVAVILTVGAFGLEVYHTVHNQYKFKTILRFSEIRNSSLFVNDTEIPYRNLPVQKKGL